MLYIYILDIRYYISPCFLDEHPRIPRQGGWMWCRSKPPWCGSLRGALWDDWTTGVPPNDLDDFGELGEPWEIYALLKGEHDPLVMTNIAIERSTIFNGKIHYVYGHFQ